MSKTTQKNKKTRPSPLPPLSRTAATGRGFDESVVRWRDLWKDVRDSKRHALISGSCVQTDTDRRFEVVVAAEQRVAVGTLGMLSRSSCREPPFPKVTLKALIWWILAHVVSDVSACLFGGVRGSRVGGPSYPLCPVGV